MLKKYKMYVTYTDTNLMGKCIMQWLFVSQAGGKITSIKDCESESWPGDCSSLPWL